MRSLRLQRQGPTALTFPTTQGILTITKLSTFIRTWLSTSTSTPTLGVIAAAMALSGKKQIKEGAPPTPEQTVQSVKADVAEIKESAKR